MQAENRPRLLQSRAACLQLLAAGLALFTCTQSGDPRIFGRVYVGTDGRGILYGDIAAKARGKVASR